MADMNKTIFKQETKKFKPVNKQAALIVRRASWLYAPPEPEATFAPTQAEILAQHRESRLMRLKSIQEEAVQRIARRKAIREANRKPDKPKVQKNKWMLKAMRQMAKSRGLPPPTKAEITLAQKSLPNYGKPLYAT
jgi:hypothetical protein